MGSILFITFLIVLVTTWTPLKVLAINTNVQSSVNKVQEKVANGYAKKFCNAIGIGLSKESALKLSIRENESPSFNPSLWTELAFSGQENIDDIDEVTTGNVVLEASCYNSDFQIVYDNAYGNEVTEQVDAGTWSVNFEQTLGTWQRLQIDPYDNANVNLAIWYRGNKMASFEGECSYHTLTATLE